MEQEEKLRETEIRAALEPRLARSANRQEMTREAASLLFFTYGIYPSAKTVREFTNHGSLADINADLRKFWSEIREKSQISLDMPGVPISVVSSLEKAIRHVWKDALGEANATLDGERAEIAAQHLAMEQKVAAATLARSESDAEAQGERERRERAEGLVESLRAELEGVRALAEQWKQQSLAEAESRAKAEERFSQDLQSANDARQRDMDMLNGEIKFAKLQIEQARSETRDAKEMLERERNRKDDEISAFRTRCFGLEESVTKLKGQAVEFQLRAENSERRCVTLDERLKTLLSASSSKVKTGNRKYKLSLPRVLRKKI